MLENWHFGKWLIGGNLIGHWLSIQMLIYVVAGVQGLPAAGVLKAGQLVFGPLRLIATALRSLLPISFSKTLHGEGLEGVRQQVRAIYGWMAPAFASYCLLAAILGEYLLQLLFGDEFEGKRICCRVISYRLVTRVNGIHP